jgi:hypothetical protein
MNNDSLHDRALAFLLKAFKLEHSYGNSTEEEYNEAVDSLLRMDTPELLGMYKTWEFIGEDDD